MSQEPSWNHAEVFPILARLVDSSSCQQPRWLTGSEIAAALLADAAGRALLETARDEHRAGHSLEWYASHVVAWFDRQLAEGTSAWSRGFERRRIDGVWAYRPGHHG
ncbi:MAG: hypothetical protein AB7U73_15810 [Pirellulales bacterium]